MSISGGLFLDFDNSTFIKVSGNCVLNPSFNNNPFICQHGKTCFACASVSAFKSTINRIPDNEREIPKSDECLNCVLGGYHGKGGGSCCKTIRFLEDKFKFGVKFEKLNNEIQPSVRDILTMSHILCFSTSNIGWDNVKAGSLLEKPAGEKTNSSHAVLIEGYNFEEKCLICKNSWENAAKRFNVRLDALHEFSITCVFTDTDLRKEKGNKSLPKRFVTELDGQKIHAVYVDEKTATFSPDYVCEESSILLAHMYIGYDIDEFILIKSGNQNPIEIGADETVVEQFGHLQKEAKRKVEEAERKAEEAMKEAVKEIEKKIVKEKKRTAKAKMKTAEAEERMEEVERKAEEAERKAEEAERKAAKEKKRTAKAKMKIAEAEERVEEVERRTEEAIKDAVKEAEKKAEKRTEEAVKKAVREAEKRTEEVVKEAVKEAVREAEKKTEEAVKEAVKEAEKKTEEAVKEAVKEAGKNFNDTIQELMKQMQDQQKMQVEAFEERLKASEQMVVRVCRENETLTEEMERQSVEKMGKAGCCGCARLCSAKSSPSPSHTHI